MTVYLIGAGIGDRSYLTVRALEILARAEVLIYDALIEPSLLELVPQNCLKIDVGKRGGKASTPQDRIGRLLVDHGRNKNTVVRLKSGDPGVFGRLNPEIAALRAQNCDFELIPGISSALAAPLLAGISLTDKLDSKCLTILSGNDPDSLDWQALGKMDTLVILMGGRNLATIVNQLMGNGRSPDFPIAIIRWAGRDNQEIWLGTLGNILDKTADVALSPCVIVIGKVLGSLI